MTVPAEKPARRLVIVLERNRDRRGAERTGRASPSLLRIRGFPGREPSGKAVEGPPPEGPRDAHHAGQAVRGVAAAAAASMAY